MKASTMVKTLGCAGGLVAMTVGGVVATAGVAVRGQPDDAASPASAHGLVAAR